MPNAVRFFYFTFSWTLYCVCLCVMYAHMYVYMKHWCLSSGTTHDDPMVHNPIHESLQKEWQVQPPITNVLTLRFVMIQILIYKYVSCKQDQVSKALFKIQVFQDVTLCSWHLDCLTLSTDTVLFQKINIYQSTWHNIPKDLNPVSSRLSNFTKTINMETCGGGKKITHSSSSCIYALPPNYTIHLSSSA